MAHMPSSNGPLAGIRVIDLTNVIFGPYATQTLAEYGADVIKVEPPEGDSTRHTGARAEPGMASLFLGANRGKRSVVLDLKTQEGLEALLALVASADVFIHNMRPHKLAQLGITAEAMLQRHPRLVFAALVGFGSAGPYAGQPAYDDIIQALSGAADLVRRQVGEPRYFPTVFADKVCGQMAAHAVLAALFQRERGGGGQALEVPMFECVTSFLLVEHLYARHMVGEPTGGHVDGQVDEASTGYPRTLAAWRRPYRTMDGFACVMPYTDENWRRFFAGAGHPEMMDDPRFSTMAARTRNIEPLLSFVADTVVRQPTAHWHGFCARQDIPFAPVNRLEDLEEDPHLKAVDFFQVLQEEGGPSYRFTRPPIAVGSPAAVLRRPPLLGEHTEEVFGELGCAVLS